MTDKFKFDPEHTFFTSDTHFGHANIINLCKRPFKDVNHMNEVLVDPRKEGLFWSEEDFNFDFDKLLGTVKFPELNKGERIEMNLQFEFGIK